MKLYHFTYLWLLIFVTAVGCTLDVADSSTDNTITEADLMAARQIIGEAISSDNSGVVLDINDALTIIAQTGNGGSAPVMQAKDRSGLDNKFNVQTTYNQKSGIFSVSFQREVLDPLFSKTVSNDLTYLYRDDQNDIIANPSKKIRDIRSVNFTSQRQGKIKTLSSTTNFNKKDTLFISGFDGKSPKTIEGTHTDNGAVMIKPPGRNQIERTYELELNFLALNSQIPLDKEKQSLSLSLEGTMNFELILRKKGSSRKTIQGTIEITNGKTGVLKFRANTAQFLIDLKNGEVLNLRKEFKGRVESVDISRKRFSLSSGIVVFVDDNTIFGDLTFRTLQSVKESLADNKLIAVEGEGMIENNKLTATSLNFEIENSQLVNQKETIEFNEIVSAVHASANSIMLGGKVELLLTDTTKFDKTSDYSSLKQVSNGLQSGNTITVKGEAIAKGDALQVRKSGAIKFKRIGNTN